MSETWATRRQNQRQNQIWNSRNRLDRYPSHDGSLRSDRGQVVVEYVLLLIVSVTLAFIIAKFMVGRDPGNPGFVIKTWQGIVQEIGRDRADDIRQ